MSAITESRGSTPSPLSRLFEYPDLVPLVLENLLRPKELAVAARVCKGWTGYSQRLLYKEVWVRPWESAPKRKFLGLFKTLKRRPELCDLIQSLDIRFFPLEMQGSNREELEHDIATVLLRLVNLKKLVWTRDRSTTFELWSSIISLPNLMHLEISGRTGLDFSGSLLAELFGSMPSLRDLRIMMPDPGFSAALPLICKKLHSRPDGGLHGLTLICKSNPWFSDEVLQDIAPCLTLLKRLEFLGLTRITQTGTLAILRSAPGLQELILDAPTGSGIEDINAHLPCLQRLSISYNPGDERILQPAAMPRLPDSNNLRALEIKHTKGVYGGDMTPAAIEELQRMCDLSKLTRVSFKDMHVPGDVLETLVRSCPVLEELFIDVTSSLYIGILRNHPTLRILHLNSGMYLHHEELARIASLIPHVNEMGSANRVHRVHRRWEGEERVVELKTWDQPFPPRYFQIWRP